MHVKEREPAYSENLVLKKSLGKEFIETNVGCRQQNPEGRVSLSLLIFPMSNKTQIRNFFVCKQTSSLTDWGAKTDLKPDNLSALI